MGKRSTLGVVGLLMIFTGPMRALAVPELSLGPVDALPGGTATVPLVLTAGSVGTVQFDIGFDPDRLSIQPRSDCRLADSGLFNRCFFDEGGQPTFPKNLRCSDNSGICETSDDCPGAATCSVLRIAFGCSDINEPLFEIPPGPVMECDFSVDADAAGEVLLENTCAAALASGERICGFPDAIPPTGPCICRDGAVRLPPPPPTDTPRPTETGTPTSTPTPTSTNIPTFTSSPTPTPTATPVPTETPTPIPAPDHYVLYQVKASKQPDKSDKFPKLFNITLDDVTLPVTAIDNPENFLVKKVKNLALPAEKNGDGPPTRPGISYLYYQIAGAKQGIGPMDAKGKFPKAVKHVPRRWELQNDFGTLSVDSKKVSALLLPATSTEVDSSPGDPGDEAHFICYKVKASKDVFSDQTPGKCGRAAQANVKGPCLDDSDCGGPADRRFFCEKPKFRRDLQAFFGDAFDDCASFKDGLPAWDGNTAIAGTCLFDVRAPKELCNPAAKSAVTGGRETSAVIDASVPTIGGSLLCYAAKLSGKIKNESVAALSGIALDEKPPKQAKHVKRKKKDGNQVYTAPGNNFPSPVEVDTNGMKMVCVPTEVIDVSIQP